MKKILALLLTLIFLTAAASSCLAEAPGRKKIVVLATGGTIAGVGEAGKTAGYKPGSLTAEQLLAAVPELEQVADIEAIQVCNVNSDDITAEIWLTDDVKAVDRKDGTKALIDRSGKQRMAMSASNRILTEDFFMQLFDLSA